MEHQEAVLLHGQYLHPEEVGRYEAHRTPSVASVASRKRKRAAKLLSRTKTAQGISAISASGESQPF